MKALFPASLILATLSLGACGTRSPDDAGVAPDVDAGTASQENPFAPTDTDDGGTDPLFSPELPGAVDEEPDAGLDPIFAPDTQTSDPIDDGAAAPLDPIFSPDTEPSDPTDDTDAGPVIDPATEPVAPPSDPVADPAVDPAPDASLGDAIAPPAFPGRQDAARLHAALTRVLGATLLDLNARISGGMELSEQQSDCLGTYDPALGEAALAIDCERALATEPVAIYVERGAFASTEACRAALASGMAEDCVLLFASAIVPTRFVSQDRRAIPVAGSGVVIRHGIDSGVFEVSREPSAPFGHFHCAIDVVTGSVLPYSVGDCDTVLRDSALFVDTLLAPS